MTKLTLVIYHDNEEKVRFEHQDTDFAAFKWMLDHQGNSINHAIKYEKWKVEQIDEETGESTYWKPYA